MKTVIVILLTAIFSTVAFSQGQSARLAGMGNLSIALPDPESEVLVNPAKGSRLKGIVVRGNPFLSNYSSKREGSSTSSSGSSSYSTSWSNAIDNGVTLLPVDAFISLGPLFFGGSAGISSLSSNGSYEDDESGQSYRRTTSGKSENTISGKTLTARGGLDIGILSVGGAASLISQAGESKSNSRSSYSGGTPSSFSFESEYKDEGSGRIFQLGVLSGNPEQFELSVVASLQSFDTEGKPTKLVYDGGADPLREPRISYGRDSFKGISADVRHQLTDRLLVGGRVGLSSSVSDQSEKYRWYDQGNFQGTYEERKTGTREASKYQFAAGLTWQVTGTALLGLELSLSPATDVQKSFYTTTGTTPDNRRYNRGDVISESTFDVTTKSLRLGGELAISEGFTLRSGGEVIWMTAESSSKGDYYSGSSESKGQTSSTFYVSGGFSYNLGIIRIDYAFGMIPVQEFVYNPYGPSFYPEQNVRFQHYVTATMQL